jgi:hypothetical protein
LPGFGAFSLGEVYATDAVQMGAQVKAGGIAGLLFAPSFGGGQGRLFDINWVCELA